MKCIASQLSYQVDFTRYNEHLVDVTLCFYPVCNQHKLWLPTWIAGSYLLREFSKNITKVSYTQNHVSKTAEKISKNQWELTDLIQNTMVTIHYEVYCRDLSVRTAFVDNQRIFGNFTSLLLMVEGLENNLADISLFIPENFCQNHPNLQIATGLGYQKQDVLEGVMIKFLPICAFESYDYPFEIGTQTFFEFYTTSSKGDILHRFFVAGRHDADLSRLKNDVRKICQTYINWLGDTPFVDYTFMTMVTRSDYGGLEHINSTALISSRDDLPSVFEPDEPNENYQRFLGLCSHEYFHAWWVKTVRPDVMMDNDLQTEAYTPLLWVFEGFTSYLDDLMLLASGVISKQAYFELILNQINRYLQTDGRHHQSVAESSFDAWIKLYRADENTANQGVSYYNKGALVALCLDLILLQKTNGKHRLFDVVKTFYQKAKQMPNQRFAMTNDNLSAVVSEFLGHETWQMFYCQYVIGLDELPIETLLTKFGFSTQTRQKNTPWGIKADDGINGLKIKNLYRNSAASSAGLSVDDVIVAINQIKANYQELAKVNIKQTYTNQPVKVHAFRRDELLEFTLMPDKNTHHKQLTFEHYQEKGWLMFDKWIAD